MDDSIYNTLFPPAQDGYRERPSAQRPEYIEKIRAEARGEVYRPAARKKGEPAELDPFTVSRLFTIEKGNRWMELGEREPEAKQLFGEFWHQGELCILFADTNAGKSVLAVQIANNIARGKQTGPFVCTAKPEKVMYVDFELTTTQFYQRYSGPKGAHEFPDNFYRAQFNAENATIDKSNSYDDLLMAGLAYKINKVQASVLIIDNISCLRGGTESAAVALRLMNNLKRLKADHKLSILVVAHTPKRRNPARPLAAEDLHGSKLLINFADSAFAIGKSTTNAGLCYLKQIKQRNTEQIYGEDNVALCRISKAPLSRSNPGNFLHFDFEGYDAERPHIRVAYRHGYNRSLVDHAQLATQIAALSAEGLSQRQIALRLNIGLGTVNKLMHQGNPDENSAAVCPAPPARQDTQVVKDEDNMTYVPAGSLEEDPALREVVIDEYNSADSSTAGVPTVSFVAGSPTESLVEEVPPVNSIRAWLLGEPGARMPLVSVVSRNSEDEETVTGARANSPP